MKKINYISETVAFIVSRLSQIERETQKVLMLSNKYLCMTGIRGAGYIQTIFDLLKHTREHLWSPNAIISMIWRHKSAKSATGV